ncbi:hypothetical protein PGT21_035677 [Puccinia graminis f. sp. tritici]|uniref:Uncharacterized protein n=1 Tax=Puccinia graminis f. sp. tritici TaxID=56615 RepID=A0A5B0QDK2_PUCGR|nr:hypothetical protein PGT21_035677 [Puccinia graminis f. sp. tritici]
MNIPGFIIVARQHGRTTYACEACPGRTTLNPVEHLQSRTHLINASLVQPIPETFNQDTQMYSGTGSEPEDTALAFETIDISSGNPENSDNDVVIVPTRTTELSIFNPNQFQEVEFEDEGDWDDSIFEAVNLVQGTALERDVSLLNDGVNRNTLTHWYPYQNREALIGTLMQGYMRCSISRSMYSQMRLILSITGLELPHWNTIRNTSESIRMLLNFHVLENESIWNHKCFSLSIPQILEQEISNPYVHPHLDFYPEDPNGQNIFKLSQSKKWCEELGPNERVQMVVSNDKHFYIFEPTQLKSGKVVVPVYFYKMNNEIYAKCTKPFISPTSHDAKVLKIEFEGALEFTSDRLQAIKVSEFKNIYSEIIWGNFGKLAEACKSLIWEIGNEIPLTLPNKWRFMSRGRVIRHMPINLYCDDTSGNISKQFNKHVSFYFTLSGLPPNVANQEFNCHFVTTSNQASVLELADKITDDMNDLATGGHVAYDYELGQDVLIMSVVLCFQGDSPMHAEVTCTHMPNASLNSCRMCKLKAASIEDRRSLQYIQHFIGRDTQGHVCRPSPRTWKETKTTAKYLWRLSKTEPKTVVDRMITDLGVKDNINKQAMDIMREGNDQQLIEKIRSLDNEDDQDQLFSPIMRLKGFDGCKDTPVEILHVFLLGVVKYLT